MGVLKPIFMREIKGFLYTGTHDKKKHFNLKIF